jgi:hypothetical protein
MHVTETPHPVSKWKEVEGILQEWDGVALLSGPVLLVPT